MSGGQAIVALGLPAQPQLKGGFTAVSTAILFLLICQSGFAHPSAPLRGQMPQANNPGPAVSDFPDESSEAEAANEEREFVRHLNGLLQALNDFATTYKAGMVDVRKVKAVRKALHDLEKSPWFKTPRTAPATGPDAHGLR